MVLLTRRMHVLFAKKQLFNLIRNFSVVQIMKDILKPPKLQMSSLQRELLYKRVQVPCLIFPNIKIVNDLRKYLKQYTLKIPKLTPVIKGEDVRLLLNPNVVKSWNDLSDDTRTKLLSMEMNEEHISHQEITLTYENWNADDILRSVLPDDIEIARSFSQVGHIIHLNLRDHHLEYKQLIAEVLLDKIPNAKTVVNKVTEINNMFRNFNMELVCGDNLMITSVKENYSKFEFDFSKVYWNPRLSTEHQRVVDLLSPGDVLFDAFCGVGPFSIPSAKKKVMVYANDLNPDCYTWLNHNININKIDKKFIKTFNKDAVEFIKTDIKQILLSLAVDNTFKGNTHVTMNLPALSLEFVKHYRNIFNEKDISIDSISRVMPQIHVYFFVNGADKYEAAKIEFLSHTGLDFDDTSMSYQFVRNVAPNKNMVKISFKPPINFIFDCKKDSEDDLILEPNTKKSRSENS